MYNGQCTIEARGLLLFRAAVPGEVQDAAERALTLRLLNPEGAHASAMSASLS